MALNSVNKKLVYLEERQKDLIDEIRELMGCNEGQGNMGRFEEEAIKEEEEAFEETNRLEGGYPEEEEEQGGQFGKADENTDRSSTEKDVGNFKRLLQGQLGNGQKRRGQPFFKVSGVDEMIGKFLDERCMKQMLHGE